MRERIGQGLFTNAAAKRDPAPVIDRLRATGMDEERLDELAGLVRRSGSLIFQRVDPPGQASRDAFLDAIRDYVATEATRLPITELDGSIASIRTAERGNHMILACRARCDFMKLPVDVRLSAAILRAEAEFGHLQKDIEDAVLAAGPKFSVAGGVMLKRENGQPLSPEAAHSSLVWALGGTLKMEAFGGKLFDKAGRIVLPELPPVGEDEIFRMGSDMALGMFWYRWERFHETARYLSQDIKVFEGKDLPEDTDPRIRTFFTRDPEINFPDWVANYRSHDRESQSGVEMMLTMNLEERAKGIRGSVAMLPEEWISAEEVGHAAALSETVGYNVTEDQERLGGLRLVHWIRGLTALSAWAAERSKSGPGILRTSRDELADLLDRMSLTPDEAERFLDAVSFAKSSRDLYDAPVVRTQTDWLVIGPAVANQRLAKIIPSMLAARNIPVRRKGEAFEARVLDFLRSKGLDARAVKVFRKGQEYQYDVLARWGGYMFLFECKNRGLSNGDPAAAYHFLSQTAEDIEQVQRLTGALSEHPDILRDEFGAGAEALTIVPVVLHNEPFQLKGDLDGVHVYDWSALTRFFKERSFHAARVHRIAGKPVFNRVPLKSVWKGDAPVPEDLLAELADPHQLMLFEKHQEWQPSDFQLDEQCVVRDWALVRTPMTEESMAEACGRSAHEVIAELDQRDAQLDELKKRLGAAAQGGSGSA